MPSDPGMYSGRVCGAAGGTLFIGEITGAYADEQCMTGGAPDVEKIQPFVLTMLTTTTGCLEPCGGAWQIGKTTAPDPRVLRHGIGGYTTEVRCSRRWVRPEISGPAATGRSCLQRDLPGSHEYLRGGQTVPILDAFRLRGDHGNSHQTPARPVRRLAQS